MLRSLKNLELYTVAAVDGDVGTVANFLLDDQHWTIRYLVVQTDHSFEGRQVLVSPVTVSQMDWQTKRVHLSATMAIVKASPNVDLDKPVSRQHEADYYRHYGHPQYWGEVGLWGMSAYPGLLATGTWSEPKTLLVDKGPDAHLRSAKEVNGYHIEGTDGAIGHIEDFLVDDETWQIRYLVIDTSNWWMGKKVLVAPQWASRVSWADKKVFLEMSREGVRGSPLYNPEAAINRTYEQRLYDFHGRPAYWMPEPAALEARTLAEPPRPAPPRPAPSNRLV